MFSHQLTDIVAACVLAAVPLALVVAAVYDFFSFPCTAGQYGLYLYNRIYSGLVWRAEISSPLPLPPHQGGVVICNHRSGMDPNLVQLITRRCIHWMVAREYCEHALLGWAFRTLEAIPVGRAGVDTQATKSAIRWAQQGNLVGVFPEGRINTTAEFMLPGRPGAALIALKARVPVVPCYVEGSPYGGTPESSYLMLAHTKVRVGRPLDLSAFYGKEDDRATLDALTRLFMREIAALAGRKDFEPKLAGRNWYPRPTTPNQPASPSRA